MANYQQFLGGCVSYKTVRSGAVVGLCVLQVVETSRHDCLVPDHKHIQFCIEIAQFFLRICQFIIRKIRAHPFLVFFHAPVVKNSGAAVVATKAFGAVWQHAKLLPKIKHERPTVEGGRKHHGRHGYERIVGKKARRDALFVVVFEKSQHSLTVVSRFVLPHPRYVVGVAVALHQTPQCIIKPHFVVQIIELTPKNIVLVLGGVIHFGNENKVRIMRF